MAAVGHTKRTAKVNPWVGRTSRNPVENESSTGSSGSSEVNHSSVECKAVRTIFVIALAFVICWVPYFVESFAALRGYTSSPTFSAAAICFLFSTGILNPLIYAFMNRVTRREIGRFVCGSTSSSESDEFASTSMSTHTSNWTSQNSKVRSRSLGIWNNDMHTIVEENEDSVFVKEDENLQDCPTSQKAEIKPHGRRSQSRTDKILLHTDSHLTTNSTEIFVEANENVPHIVEDTVKPSTSKEKTVTIGSAQVIGDSRWKIVNSEKFKEEKRRFSTKQNEAYFARPKRRKKRDCGSFLYFEHQTDDFPSLSRARQHKQRPERFSVDHVHSVSLGQFPTFMKLKVSLNDTDLHAFNKVTVQSNIAIENKSFADKRNESDRGRKTSENERSPETAPVSQPEYVNTWTPGIGTTREHGSQKVVKMAKISRGNEVYVTPFTLNEKERIYGRERFRSEPFNILPHSRAFVSSDNTSPADEDCTDKVDDVNCDNDDLDRYLD